MYYQLYLNVSIIVIIIIASRINATLEFCYFSVLINAFA